jgi:hypothetical protein
MFLLLGFVVDPGCSPAAEEMDFMKSGRLPGRNCDIV